MPEKKGGDGKIRALIKGWNCAANNNPQDGETDLGRSGWTGNCACDNNKKSVAIKTRYNVDCVGAKGREMCAE